MGKLLWPVFALGVIGGLGWFARHARAVWRGNFRPAEGSGRPWWVPGGGTHGSTGGQVPPLVPYNEDWEPQRRIE